MMRCFCVATSICISSAGPMHTSALGLLLACTPALATPLNRPPQQAPWLASPPAALPSHPWTSQSNADHDPTKLLEKYAPILKLSKDEKYFPSTVDYMLPHYEYIENTSGDSYPANHTILTPSELDTLPLSGSQLFLSISEPHNPQPALLNAESHYLYGPAGQKGGIDLSSGDGRGRVNEPVYGFWVDQGRGIVDLWYWTFYPFNFGKPAGRFGVLGNHVADWEHFRMRTVNGTPISADFSTHEGGYLSAGTLRWEDVEKVGERPVAYVAMGSHGIWPDPGEHVYAEIGNLLKIIDSTDDLGPIWDTESHVLPVQYWTNSSDRQRLQHEGEDSWRNFKGYWGNKGDTDCWWHGIVGICQVVDAPPGPNRYFGSPPECLLAPISSAPTSTISFYLSSPAIDWATNNSIAMVQVEQICERPKKDRGGEDVQDMESDTDYANDDDVEVYGVKGLTNFVGDEKHSIELPACKGLQSALRGYRVSLCLLNGRCLSTSRERKICAYEEGKRGHKAGSAVLLDDIDDWLWNF
ncbi:hypothetical protein L202_04467 [Cryptococcus amylolentus CBS 6039]|uniref:Vacuolar protein sorting-associated protein 62 n=1 Tax=Cryptococcus amylolentus CBS 6039 TaxID=1295533 RepID=A0A1E3HRL4_9TREE|nr:hypothetical protein L202_04467 [Cryptococcus amylolentus CBS 6039]ODN78952.1 hypothetical protein L202_04467 [Cryptococcus amylolentus CBS 6039]